MNRLIPLAILALLLVAAAAPASAHYYGPHPHIYGSVAFGYPTAYGAYPYDEDGRPLGAIDLDVSPEETKVWVDGRLVGTCDDFDGYPQWLFLPPGTHQLKLVSPEGRVHNEKVRIKAGLKLNYDLDLGR